MAALLTSELADLTRALEKAAPAQGATPAPVAADASATATAAPSTSTTGDLPRALDILRSMLSARVTVEELKLTKAGLLVARLSKSEHADIAKLAKEVMAQWKKAVLPPSAPTGVEQAKAAAAAAAQAKAAADAKKAAEAAAAAAAAADAKKKKKETDSSKKSSGESSSDESERDRDGKKDKKKDKKRSKEKDGESKEESKKKRSKTSPSPTPAATKAPVAAPKPAAVGSDASLALQHPELARDGPFALFRTDDSQRDKMQWMIYSALGDPTPAAHQALAEEQEKAKVDLSQYKSNSSKATAAAPVAAPEEESKTAPSDVAPDAAIVATASPTADSTAPASALPADPTPAAIPAVATAAPSLRSRAELAFLIEAAMFNKLGQNSNSTAYKQKYRDLAPQLKDPNNGELNVSLYLGRLVPDELVMMSLAALAPAALKDKRAKEAAWSREAARCDIGLDAGATDIFQCDVCKERRCTYFQMQTRGADEPMTIFVTCLVCGNKFRSGDGER